MKLSWQTESVQLLVIIGMFAVAALAWPHVPERMPVHWNLEGQVDGYGGKFSGLLMLPLITLGVYALTLALPLIDPRRANYASFATAYNAIRITLVLFMTAVYGVIVLVGLGYAVSMSTVMGWALAILFIVLGTVMHKIRPNWFVGVRTPWTLTSELSWTKTHRLAGWLFVAIGLALAAWAMSQQTWAFVVAMAIAGASVLWIVVYSYLVYRADPARTPGSQ
jgi:uncharacterized membrane protein